jgi:rubredoxin
MRQGIDTSRAAADEYVEFWAAGQTVKGEFHCSGCGYGVTIVRALPVCPMCGGSSWEQFPWSPFTRSHESL